MDTGRDREELRAKLAPWLADRMGLSGLQIGAVEIPSTSGVANETILVEAFWTNRGQQSRQGLAVRIAPDRPLFAGRSFRSQYLVQEALQAEPDVPVPARWPIWGGGSRWTATLGNCYRGWAGPTS